MAALALPTTAIAQVQLNQNFNAQGPGPSIGPSTTIQSGDNPPNGTVTGAVQSIVVDPSNANIIYIGTPVGGIWKTTDGGATWTPETDKQSSPSISSLSLDPTDATHQTLVAGFGTTSNGGAPFSGGFPNGLLYSTNGGTSWSPLAGSSIFSGQTVADVDARGQTILAATYALRGAGTTGGLYLSTNGGANFNLISGTGTGTVNRAGLPAGPVSSLIADPANSTNAATNGTFYAAITAPTANAAGFLSTSIWRTTDNGATWTQIFNSTNSGGTIVNSAQTVIRLAAGPGNTLAAGVLNFATCTPQPCSNPPQTGTMTGLFYTSTANAATPTWTQLPAAQLPGATLNPGKQAAPNFAIAIDPNNTKYVYVSGDDILTGNDTVTAYRVDFVALTATSLTGANTSNGSTTHADSRFLTIDPNGRLLLSSDGGIYARSNPQTNAGQWTSLIGNLAVSEVYAIAYDANSKRVVVASQDTGTTLQSSPGSATFNAIGGGDGTNAIINDTSLAGRSVIYTSAACLNDQGTKPNGCSTSNQGLPNRLIINSSGTAVGTTPGPAGSTINFNVAINNLYFSSPMILNKTNQSLIAIGGSDLYVTQDPLTGGNGANPNPATVNLNLTDVGTTTVGTNIGAIKTIAYGTTDNSNVIAAGSSTGVWLSTNATTANSLNQLTTYAGNGPFSMVFDNRSQNRLFVADGTNVYETTNATTTPASVVFTNLSANLPASINNPNTVEFISNNGVNALLVGGQNAGIANAQSTIAVADSDGSGNLSGWRLFGSGLPNTIIGDMVYNPAVDVLAVGTFGRGAFLLYDVTSYFPQATVLQFGLANNSSTVDASFLTDGTVGGPRPLIKYGPGTLLITGAATYTGTTTINGGVLQLGDGTNTGSLFGFGNVITTAGTHINLQPGIAFAGIINGDISGPGDLTQAGPGTFILNGTNTYTGGTTITAGTLQLGNGGTTGSITGDVTDNGVFAVNRTDSYTYAGNITGAGSFNQLGSGTTIFTGTNSYGGGTTISNGTLQLGNGSTTGSITGNVTDNGMFAVDRSNTYTFGGNISGFGSFQQMGAGTTVLTGTNTYLGTTTVTLGTLQAGAVNTFSPNSATTVAAGAILDLNNFNQTIASLAGAGNVTLGTATLMTGGDNTSTTFSGAILGGGGLTKQGSGIFTLSGLGNAYTGPTNINAGILNVIGSIATSPTFVNTGGMLVGTGTVGPTTVNAGGTLSPGGLSAIGMLGVNGNLTFNAGSQYSIRVLDNNVDRTNATGSATLAGTVTATFLSTNLIHNYTIISASGGVAGTFGNLVPVNLSGLFDPSLAYTPTTANLILSLDLAKIAGLSPNQLAVSNSIDNFFNSGGLGGFLPALFKLNPAQIPAVLNQLSGEGTSGTQETAFGAGGMFLSAMMDQGAFWRTDGTIDPHGVTLQGGPAEPLQYAPTKSEPPAYKAIGNAAPTVYSPAYYAPRWRAWFAGFDGASKLNGEPSIGSATLGHQTAGGAAGVDYQLNPNLLLGFASSGSTSNFSVADRSTSGQLDGGHLGVYGVGRGNSLYAAFAAAFSVFDTSTTRTISGIGPAETAKSHFDSELFSSRFEVGSRFPWSPNFSLTPFAAIQFSALHQPGNTESSTVIGAAAPGVLGLAYASQTVQSLPSFLGLRSDASITFQNGNVWAPYAAVSWVHEFEPSREVTPTFLALPGAFFTVDGPRAARDAVKVDVGSKLVVAANIALFGSFNGEFSDRSQMYAGKAGLKVAW